MFSAVFSAARKKFAKYVVKHHGGIAGETKEVSMMVRLEKLAMFVRL
jgi:hypothetical protein